MVWPFEASADRRVKPLAIDRCHYFLMGNSIFEYCCQVPANRIGFQGNGGPFSLVQLKVVQECISLIVFALIANIMFQGETLKWNHLLAFVFIIAAVYLVFK